MLFETCHFLFHGYSQPLPGFLHRVTAVLLLLPCSRLSPAWGSLSSPAAAAMPVDLTFSSGLLTLDSIGS